MIIRSFKTGSDPKQVRLITSIWARRGQATEGEPALKIFWIRNHTNVYFHTLKRWSRRNFKNEIDMVLQKKINKIL